MAGWISLIAREREPQRVLQLAAETVAKRTGASGCAAAICRAAGVGVDCELHARVGAIGAPRVCALIPPLLRRTVDARYPVSIETTASMEIGLADSPPSPLTLVVPLLSSDRAFGWLWSTYASPSQLGEQQRALACDVASVACAAIEAGPGGRRLALDDAGYREVIERIPAVTYCRERGRPSTAAYISPQIEQLTGFSAEAFLADPSLWIRQLHPDDRQRVLREGQSYDRSGANHPAHAEYRVLHRDGTTIWVRNHAVGVAAEPGGKQLVTGVIFDITEQRRLEVQLRTAQRMEAIGRLAGGVAHDFNNLLTVIQSYGEFLLDELEEEDSTPHQHARVILEAADHAARLTRQLLTFSRRQLQQLEVLDVDELLGELAPTFEPLLGDGIALRTILRSHSSVRADAAALEQALTKLVVNAREAMPDGGELTIETRTAEPREVLDDLPEAVAEAESYLLISIRDTGCGMDGATLSHLFEPFFSTKKCTKGAGLGLAMVYGIFKHHGGGIAVSSEPNQGTTFRLYLPEVIRRRRRATPAQPRARHADGHQTILLVEDDPGVLRAASRILRYHGYLVLEAESGEEALSFCQRSTQPIDLLLTDLLMPAMSGWELAQRVRALRPRLHILYMSGNASNAVLRLGGSEARFALLPKPFDTHTLLSAVTRALTAPETDP